MRTTITGPGQSYATLHEPYSCRVPRTLLGSYPSPPLSLHLHEPRQYPSTKWSYRALTTLIRLHRGDALVVHPSKNGRVVTLEYEVHGKILATGAPYDNRLIAVVTIENPRIVHWRDYMDSLAAWMALNNTS